MQLQPKSIDIAT